MGLRVRIKTDTFEYDLELLYKVSRITGNSGSHKTTAWRALQDFCNNNDRENVEVHCPLRVIPVSYSNIPLFKMAFEQIYTDALVFVDEGLYDYDAGMILKCIRQSTNSYFVFITRSKLGWLSYNSKALYELVKTGHGVHKLRALYPNTVISTGTLNFDKVVTEDKCSGYYFFSAAFKCPVISAEGKSNVHKFADNALSIVDGAAFGSVIEQFLASNTRFVLYLPESFEWLLIASRVVPNAELQHTDVYRYEGYTSFEQLCTHILSQAVQVYGFSYHKSEIPKQFLQRSNINKVLFYISAVLSKEVVPNVEYDFFG